MVHSAAPSVKEPVKSLTTTPCLPATSDAHSSSAASCGSSRSVTDCAPPRLTRVSAAGAAGAGWRVVALERSEAISVCKLPMLTSAGSCTQRDAASRAE